MLDRLMGQETEYALRFSPHEASPGNGALFDALAAQVEREVPTLPGARRLARRQRFLANGGSFYYEFLPYETQGGLVEAATPECRGPSALLQYQVGQDQLFARAAGQVDGQLSLLKNCRDGDGNVYGVQENYEAEIARGAGLFALRAGIVALLGVACVVVPLTWAVLLCLLISLLGGMLALGLLDVVLGALFKVSLLKRLMEGGFERNAGRAEMWLEIALLAPVLMPYAFLLRGLAFRRQRRALVAFLMSRPIIAGAGSQLEGGFVLSEKGPAIRRLMRLTIAPGDRPVFDTGNLMKRMMGPLLFDFRGVLGLFRARQRLQLGLADANRCQVAEFLKLGTTALILDMAEDGALVDAPQLADPIGALRAFIADPGLEASALDRNGRGWTALALQRFYLERARAWLDAAPAPSLEAHDVVRLWGEALDALEAEPGGLIGRIDWITKRYLLETAGADADLDVLKKIDLRYHELGSGYLDWLQDEGLAPVLVSAEDAERAITTPPHDSPAALRGRLIRQLADADLPGIASWDAVRLKGPDGRRKVVSLADWKREREER